MQLLSGTEAFIIGPLLCLMAGALLAALPLGRIITRIVALLASGLSCIVALYQYTPATNKTESILERVGPALQGFVQFRMETVAGTLLITTFAFCACLLTATRPMQDGRRERILASSALLAASAGVTLIIAKHLLLAFLALEVLGIALLAHGLASAASPGAAGPDKQCVDRATRRAARVLQAQLLAALLILEGLALLYGGQGSLSLLRIEAVNRPGLLAPEGLAALGAGLVFIGIFLRFGAFPLQRPLQREFSRSPAATRLLRAGIGVPSIFLLLLALAPQIPRATLPFLPWIAFSTILIAWLGALLASRRGAVDASLAASQVGMLLVAFAALCLGSGVQDAGYAIRAGLLALTPMGLAWLLWIGAQAALAAKHEERLPTDSFNGLGRSKPCLAIALSIAALSFAGLPPSGAFWSHWLILQALWLSAGPLPTSLIAGAFALGAVWSLRFIARLWLEPPSGFATQQTEKNSSAVGSELRFLDLGILAVLVAASLAIGLFPSLLLNALVHIKL